MKIKGFDENLRCRGFQFEIGGVYDTGAKDDQLELCTSSVFHYCDSLQKVHEYFCAEPKFNNRFCEIEVLGTEVTDGTKSGSNKIKVLREIVGDELDKLRGFANGNTGLFNSDNRNSGNRNSGNRNSGYRNSGDYNSGDWNSCDYSSGVFCSTEEKIRIFNKPSDMTMAEFLKSYYYIALTSEPLNLTEWIEYSPEEKDTSDKKETGGYLRTIPYKEACAKWWSKLRDTNKDIIKSMPNFDADVFFEITGIRV